MKHSPLYCLFAVLLFAPALCATHSVVVPHVAGNGWTTTITVFNPSLNSQSFTYTPYSDAGAAGTAVTRTVTGLGMDELTTSSDIPDLGSGRVETSGTLAYALRYRYGNSLSVCDFTLSEAKATGWLLPNPDLEWFSWVGVALVNPNSTAASVTLRAYKDGKLVGTKAVALAAQAKTTGMSTDLWGLAASEVDWMHVESSPSISAPIVISGTADQDRHLFAAGVPASLDSVTAGLGSSCTFSPDPPVWDQAVAFTETSTFQFYVGDTDLLFFNP